MCIDFILNNILNGSPPPLNLRVTKSSLNGYWSEMSDFIMLYFYDVLLLVVLHVKNILFEEAF